MKRLGSRILTLLLVFAFALALPMSSMAASATVTVTLEVLWNSASSTVTSQTYYVTAYTDAACTDVEATKSITLSNASSGTATFTFNTTSSTSSSTTYYIAESDSSGNLKTDTSTLTISYPSGNSVTVTGTSSSASASPTTLKIQNNYSQDPNTVSAKTADESQPVLFAGIAALCVLVGGAVIIMRRKQNA